MSLVVDGRFSLPCQFFGSDSRIYAKSECLNPQLHHGDVSGRMTHMPEHKAVQVSVDVSCFEWTFSNR